MTNGDKDGKSQHNYVGSGYHSKLLALAFQTDVRLASRAKTWPEASRSSKAATPLAMGIRAVENYNSDFTLDDTVSWVCDQLLGCIAART